MGEPLLWSFFGLVNIYEQKSCHHFIKMFFWGVVAILQLTDPTWNMARLDARAKRPCNFKLKTGSTDRSFVLPHKTRLTTAGWSSRYHQPRNNYGFVIYPIQYYCLWGKNFNFQHSSAQQNSKLFLFLPLKLAVQNKASRDMKEWTATVGNLSNTNIISC